MLEVLQVLTYLRKDERPDFTLHWTAREEYYLIKKATEGAINELVVSAKCEEMLNTTQMRHLDKCQISM